MRKKNYKGRCEKKSLGKCKGVCKTYDSIQFAYADILQGCNDILEFQCNIPLDNTDYMTDFLCIKTNKDLFVRECVNRKHITKPLTIKLLDVSRNYWLNHGVSDWGLVINEE